MPGDAGVGMIRVVGARYVTPLREGGSLPAIVDTEPEGRYVVKFRGAGQGPLALVAEALAAGLAHALGLPVPAAAVVRMDEGFGKGEPDPEIQDLLRWSVGLNFGLEYVPEALGFDAAADLGEVAPELAAAVVWFDALISNVDRTPRNPNILVRDGRVWLIDHGAAFWFHHGAGDWEARSRSRFPQIQDHILLSRAADLGVADARLRPLLGEEVLRRVTADLPDEWLEEEPSARREAYLAYLLARLEEPRGWLEEAEHARQRRA